jgi:hypothetical protein
MLLAHSMLLPFSEMATTPVGFFLRAFFFSKLEIVSAVFAEMIS